jgi:hypothetical protein
MASLAGFNAVAQENDVVAKGDTSKIRSQFRARASHHGWQRCKVPAIVRNFFNEGVRNGAALTFSFDASRNIRQIPSRCSPINKARHLRVLRGLPKFVKMKAHILPHLIVCEGSTLGLSGIKRVSQGGDLCLQDGMPYSILGCLKCPGSNLGHNPLLGIWGKFNFHGDLLAIIKEAAEQIYGVKYRFASGLRSGALSMLCTPN